MIPMNGKFIKYLQDDGTLDPAAPDAIEKEFEEWQKQNEELQQKEIEADVAFWIDEKGELDEDAPDYIKAYYEQHKKDL